MTIEIKDIPDRHTFRLTASRKARINNLSKMINEEDLAKILDFALETAEHHIHFVTEALVSPNWEAIFQRKRKSQKLRRRVY